DTPRAAPPSDRGSPARARGTAARSRSRRWCRCEGALPPAACSRRAPRRARSRASPGSPPAAGAARSWPLASVGHEHVARVADGANVLRALRVGLDLLAHAHHAQVDAAVERIPVALLAQVED